MMFDHKYLGICHNHSQDMNLDAGQYYIFLARKVNNLTNIFFLLKDYMFLLGIQCMTIVLYLDYNILLGNLCIGSFHLMNIDLLQNYFFSIDLPSGQSAQALIEMLPWLLLYVPALH